MTTIRELIIQQQNALALGIKNLRAKGVIVADDATIYGVMGAIERVPMYSSANNRGYEVTV